MKRTLKIAAAVAVFLSLALPWSRRAIAGSFTALTEYAIRYIQVSPSSLPTNCTTGRDCIYVSSTDGKVYHRNAAGADVSMEGGGVSTAYQTVDNAGSALTQRTTLNFTGAGVSCVDNAGATRTDCTISGGGSTGNWTFSGGGADLSSGTSMYVGSTSGTTGVATALVLGQQNGAVVWLGSNAGSGTTFTKTLNPMYFEASSASSGTQLVNSPILRWRPHYWNGSADTPYDLRLLGIMDSTGPTAHWSFNANGTEVFQFTSGKAFNIGANGSIGNISQAATNTTGLTLASNVADGASTIGTVFNAVTALSNSTAKVFSWQNGGIEKMYLDAPNNLLRFTTSNSGISDATAAAQLAFNQAGSIFFFGTTIYPLVDNSSHVGAAANRWHDVYSYWYDVAVGAQLTAAATITPTSAVHHVTGATTITTIATTNLPTSGNVELKIIADGGTITFGTGGNIAVGTTIAINTWREFFWDNTQAKWYPHN